MQKAPDFHHKIFYIRQISHQPLDKLPISGGLGSWQCLRFRGFLKPLNRRHCARMIKQLIVVLSISYYALAFEITD